MSAVFKKLGFDVLNFGKEGSGTLTQFAILKEYAMHHRPKTILWFYFGNDIYNLEKEMESDVLMNYLNDQNFSQNSYNVCLCLLRACLATFFCKNFEKSDI